MITTGRIFHLKGKHKEENKPNIQVLVQHLKKKSTLFKVCFQTHSAVQKILHSKHMR